jgi:hypothetical protein
MRIPTVWPALVPAIRAAGHEPVLELPVRFAHECPRCECCDEPFCPIHEMHYADCPCPGPDSESI